MDGSISDKKRDEMLPKGKRRPDKPECVGSRRTSLHAGPSMEWVPKEWFKVVWPDARPSLQSRLMDRLILLSGRRKWWASAAAVRERALRLALRPAPHHPVRLRRNLKIDLRFAEGWPVYHIEAAGSSRARHHVIFLHGGAYVHEIVGSHWRFLYHLVDEANALR